MIFDTFEVLITKKLRNNTSHPQPKNQTPIQPHFTNPPSPKRNQASSNEIKGMPLQPAEYSRLPKRPCPREEYQKLPVIRSKSRRPERGGEREPGTACSRQGGREYRHPSRPPASETLYAGIKLIYRR